MGSYLNSISTILKKCVHHSTHRMKTAKLTKKEDEFWEEVYNKLVLWGIHEDFTYNLCFVIIKAKFGRLKDVGKFV